MTSGRQFFSLLSVIVLSVVLIMPMTVNPDHGGGDSKDKGREVELYEIPGFFFQPPVGKDKTKIDDFDPHLDLMIEIFALVDEVAEEPPVGPSFSTNPEEKGKGKKKGKKGKKESEEIEEIKVKSGKNGYYQAKWKTKDSEQPDGALLRVEVRSANAISDVPACNDGVDVFSGCVAYFDVMLHKSNKTANWAYTPDGVMPLVNGKSLSIKFQITAGALDEAQPSQLPGDESSPAVSAIPDLEASFREEDFSTDHPELGGMMISFNTISLVFTLDTTVGEANAILASLGARIVGGMPGIAGEVEGVLLLRLPITTHEQMIAILAELRANPNVKFAVQESLLEPTVIPKPNSGVAPDPVGWTWEIMPGTDNWGMEWIRAPQMWGLNDAIDKQGTTTPTGVYDVGFLTNHEDLAYQTKNSSIQHEHGTHVAGTIGAKFNTGVGVDGVNPFSKLVVYDNGSFPSATGWGLIEMILAQPGLRMINVSLGYNWYDASPPINPNSDATAQAMATSQGSVFFLKLQILKARGQSLPFVLAAAGNDSGLPLNANIEARWSSPMNFAALALGSEEILVVEALKLDPGKTGGASRASFSNINGDISAPGSDIMSTICTSVSQTDGSCVNPTIIDEYGALSGTSMAAPHVTGLTSYLLSLDSSLSNAELRQLLLDNAVAVNGASPGIDAFASALAIDGIRGNNNILMKLVDIDDGSLDGNKRTQCDSNGLNCSEVFDQDIDGDGGRGDGAVDMSDFRAWRDWYLQASGNPALALDGIPFNDKKDLNHDGEFESAAMENIYPMGDFNGDGFIDLTSTRLVPSLGAALTDLEILMLLFDDPHYGAEELEILLESWDLEVDTGQCFARAATVRSTLFFSGSDIPLEERNHTTGESVHIYTAPSNFDYMVKVEAFDQTGALISEVTEYFTALLGGDDLLHVDCTSIVQDPESLMLTLDLDETVDRTIGLISQGLTANYELISDEPNIVIFDEQGTVEADSTYFLGLTLSCPDSGAGVYNYSFEYTWTDENGTPTFTTVPQTLDIKLTCEAENCPAPVVSSTLRTIDLGNYAGYNSTKAVAINDCGQVLGGSADGLIQIADFNVRDPYLWLPEAAYGLPPGKNRLADHGINLAPARAINNSGQIAGFIRVGGDRVPAIWDWSDGMTEIQVPGMVPGGYIDINEAGEAVTSFREDSYDSNGNYVGIQHIALFLPEAAYGLQAGTHLVHKFSSEVLSVEELSIDNNGVIFGRLYILGGLPQFFTWEAGATTILGDLGGAQRARRNIHGQIAAQYAQGTRPRSCACDVFILNPGGSIIQVGSLDGQGGSMQVLDFNDRGDVTGYGTSGSVSRAWLWRNGVTFDLGGRPESFGFGLNELGQIVGVTWRRGYPYRATVWEFAP